MRLSRVLDNRARMWFNKNMTENGTTAQISKAAARKAAREAAFAIFVQGIASRTDDDIVRQAQLTAPNLPGNTGRQTRRVHALYTAEIAARGIDTTDADAEWAAQLARTVLTGPAA